MARPRVALEARFWAKVDMTAGLFGCWEWLASKSEGYGQIGEGGTGGRHLLAHRVAWTLLVGDIPEELELDHLCRNKGCVNPVHLEPVTGRVNTMRSTAPTAINAAKAACVNGHAFTPQNTYSRPSGGRTCRACSRNVQRRYRERNAA